MAQPTKTLIQVQRWTGVVSSCEKGGFVAYGDYLALLDRLEKAEKDAERYRKLIGGKRRKYIWNHVFTVEEMEGHITLEQVLDAMEASK